MNEWYAVDYGTKRHNRIFVFKFYPLDLDCISSLVTFEHLNLMCHPATDKQGEPDKTPVSPSPDFMLPGPPSYHRSAGYCWDRRNEEALKDDTVTYVPFCFQLPRLLPKCSKAKLLFSTFVQGRSIFYIILHGFNWDWSPLARRVQPSGAVQRDSGRRSQRTPLRPADSPAVAVRPPGSDPPRQWLPLTTAESRFASSSWSASQRQRRRHHWYLVKCTQHTYL